jgi:hypothetical protein
MLCPIGAITEIVTHISAAAISSSSHQQHLSYTCNELECRLHCSAKAKVAPPHLCHAPGHHCKCIPPHQLGGAATTLEVASAAPLSSSSHQQQQPSAAAAISSSHQQQPSAAAAISSSSHQQQQPSAAAAISSSSHQQQQPSEAARQGLRQACRETETKTGTQISDIRSQTSDLRHQISDQS